MKDETEVWTVATHHYNLIQSTYQSSCGWSLVRVGIIIRKVNAVAISTCALPVQFTLRLDQRYLKYFVMMINQELRKKDDLISSFSPSLSLSVSPTDSLLYILDNTQCIWSLELVVGHSFITIIIILPLGSIAFFFFSFHFGFGGHR